MREAETLKNLLVDFCSLQTVLLVVIIMMLLAMVMVLAPGHALDGGWEALGMMAMFLQWLGLLSLAILCLAKPLMKYMSMVVAALFTFILIQFVTLIVSEAAYQLTAYQPILAHLKPDQHGLFLLRNLAISIIISGVALRYMYLQRQLQVRTQAEDQAKIQALQARIRPHFLFNSMNTIAALTQIDAAAAEKAILDLSEIYRATLQSDDAITTIGEEIKLVKHYLEVEALRLHDRLKINWDVDDEVLNMPIPRLTLQPLMENAIYHGIEPIPDGGEVSISANKNDQVEIEISNPIPLERGDLLKQGNQVAIQNICDRLAIAFGKQASLRSFQEDGHYRVVLKLPLTASKI